MKMTDKKGYHPAHSWMEKTFGRPNGCEDCNLKSVPVGMKWYFEWANISGEYKRERTDWRRLCKACHRKFDYALQPRGDNHGGAKLNQFQVQRIRLMKEIMGRKLSQHKIAKMFGMNQATISDILNNKLWKHIS